jgi:3-oxosteroid 1-dehydrogenase
MTIPHECDVLVVGSGGGGLLAAVRAHDRGLRPMVIEKADRYGGTTAVSGGGIWIPNNDAIRQEDSPELAMTYLRACTRGDVPEEKLRAYVDNAPVLVRYLMEKLGIAYYHTAGYPDYRLDLPGALPIGRHMIPKAIDGRDLGDDFFRLREPQPYYRVLRRVHIDLLDMGALIQRPPGWQWSVTKLLARYAFDLPWRFKTGRDRRLTFGNALIAGLRRNMKERGIPLHLSTPLIELVREEDRITGAVVQHKGSEHCIAVTKGVILASGGFEKSQPLRNREMSKTAVEWSITPAPNTGDGLAAAEAVGAATEFLDKAWWCPSIRLPAPVMTSTDLRVGLFSDRALPHTVCVNRNGDRFANEAMNYNDFGWAMIADNERTGANLPCWFVFDASARRKYPIGSIWPSTIRPDSLVPQEWWDNIVYKAGTIRELAAKIDIDPEKLEAVVARMNRYAETGVDEEFARGSDAYDRFFGDQRIAPNPNLGPIAKAPFYAMRLDLGDIGTKGGPKVDENANVLQEDGAPITGLYAVGNVAASVMAGAYPGPGSTIGPALTFGLVAADHLARTTTNQPGP